MTFTYDPSTDAGMVRLLSTDSVELAAIFEDNEIAAFLALQSGNVKLAAAQALDTIASSEALVQKKIKLLDLTTDGPAVAKALREHAAALRAQVNDDTLVGAFDIAEMVTNDFGLRWVMRNQFLRDEDGEPLV